MSRREFFKCDRCGHECWRDDKENFRHLFSVKLVINEGTTFRQAEWCERCCAEIGWCQRPNVKAIQPEPTLEDLIRDLIQNLIREEIQS